MKLQTLSILTILTLSCSTPKNATQVSKSYTPPKEPSIIKHISNSQDCVKTKLQTAYSSKSYNHARVTAAKLSSQRTKANGYTVNNHYKQENKKFVTIMGYKCKWIYGVTSSPPQLNDKTSLVSKKTKKEICKIQSQKDLSYGSVKRLNIFATINKKVNQKESRKCIQDIINNLYKNDKKINAVSIFIYKNKNQIGNYPFTVAKGTFAPSGNWSKAADFVDKKSNRLVVEFDKQYFKTSDSKFKTTISNGLSLKVRKKIFKEIVAAEDGSQREADAKYTNPNDFMLSIDYKRMIEKRYKNKIKRKYNLSDERLFKIGIEGVKGRWPME